MSRTVLITGGSRGLGAGLVSSFLALGDNVATCSRSRTATVDGWATQHGDRFSHLSLDLGGRGAAESLIQGVIARFGQIDVLVNNAGIARDGVLPLFPDEAIDEMIDLNLRGTIHLTRLVTRRMLRQGSGRVINISSIVGLSGYRGLSVYSATKAALDGFTRSLARELGSRGITVNSVAPGYLRTEMTHGLDAAQLRQIVRRTPGGRLWEPEDVAAAVRFLASDEAAFITGQTLVVDGGLTA